MTSLRRRVATAAIVLVAGGVVPLTAAPAHADAVITVTGTGDTLATDGQCTLREAVQAANFNANVNDCVGVGAYGDDTIVFDPAIDTLPINFTLGTELNITKSVTIVGNGAANTIIDGQALARVFNVSSTTAHVAISGVTIRNGKANIGAGIYNGGALTLADSAVTGNAASCNTFICIGGGGGIGTSGTATTVTNSTVSGNTVACTGAKCFAHGGGIISLTGGGVTVTDSTVADNKVSCTVVGDSCFSEGGGIQAGMHGDINVTSSTVSGNTVSCDAPGCLALGGGIATTIGNGPAATVINSTVTNNTVSCNTGCTNGGGGILTTNVGGIVTLTASTVADNASTCTAPCSNLGGGGISVENGSGLIVRQTILANNIPGNCIGTALVTNAGDNLSFPSACGLPNLGDPMLGPLQDNSGPTKTRELLAGSAALDAVSTVGPCAVATDQRGQFRPAPTAGSCDIGAYERQWAPPAAIALTPLSTTNPTGIADSAEAHVVDGIGESLGAGIPVTFTVTGANPVPPGTGTCAPVDCRTGPAGTVTFTYTGTLAGVDTIGACFAGPVCSNLVTKTWQVPSTGGGGGGGDSDHDGRIRVIEEFSPHQDVTIGFHTKQLKAKTFGLDDDHHRDFTDLEAGTYTVAQDKKSGWKLDKIVCQAPTHNTKIVLDTRRAVIKLKAGEQVTCTFTNKKS